MQVAVKISSNSSSEQKVSVILLVGAKLGQIKSSDQFLHFQTKILPEGGYLMQNVNCLIFIRRFRNLATTVCSKMTLNSTMESYLTALKEHLAFP